jgi:beta-lactamase class A
MECGVLEHCAKAEKHPRSGLELLKVLPIGVVQLFLALSAAADQTSAQPGVTRIPEIERDIQGRLGVAILDTANGRSIEYHANDRFPMCSTFKWLAAAAVLKRVDQNQEHLDRKISYGPADMLEWTPITKKHVQEGSMTLDALCAVESSASSDKINQAFAEVGKVVGEAF